MDIQPTAFPDIFLPLGNLSLAINRYTVALDIPQRFVTSAIRKTRILDIVFPQALMCSRTFYKLWICGFKLTGSLCVVMTHNVIVNIDVAVMLE